LCEQGSGGFRPESYPHSYRFRQRRGATAAPRLRVPIAAAELERDYHRQPAEPVAGYLAGECPQCDELARMFKLNPAGRHSTPVSDGELVVTPIKNGAGAKTMNPIDKEAYDLAITIASRDPVERRRKTSGAARATRSAAIPTFSGRCGGVAI
jgi:hypothetical protein